MVNKIIYVHGFNSSERSQKAVQFGEFVTSRGIEYCVPRLSHEPVRALEQLKACLSEHCALIGSSLGGFYATYLSQRYRIPAVVVNPVVKPHQLMHGYLGAQFNPYQDYHYTLNNEHLEQLKALDVEQFTFPELVFLLQQEADEVLPYEQAVAHYHACRQIVEQGGSHRFEGFERHFDTILEFFRTTQLEAENT